MSILAGLKKRWAEFLENLARTNRETYGSGKPDCCAPKGKGKSRAG